MSLKPVQAVYEFDRDENTVVARLSGAVKFVGVAKIATGALIAAGVLPLNLGVLGVVTVGVVSVAFIAMGILQCTAARHFRRIVATEGHDRDDLMAALVDLADTYELQRWLWIVLMAVVLIALVATTVGWSH